ncbi:MAG TPA: hypothetical protein VM638_01130, partial [Actinomycetota bacterium]|nr:hypothetical protein [Actinomycetota bacterium]
MGFFSKRGRDPNDFVPNRDMRIVVLDGDRPVEEVEDGKPYRLRTEGLHEWGRPELEITGVPLPALESAAVLLNMAAGYMVAVRPVKSGETWAAEDHGRLIVVARMFEA